MKKNSLILFAILVTGLLSCGFTACQTIPFQLKSTTEKQIAAMQAQHEIDQRNALQAISSQKDKVIVAKTDQLQGVSNSLYGANSGYKLYTNPQRLDTLINNFVTEAQAADDVPPTYQSILAVNQRLTTELDTTKTTLAQIQADHQAALAVNAQLVDEKNKQTAVLVQQQKDEAAKEQVYNDQIQAKQKVLDDTNNKIIAAEDTKKQEIQATQALKLKLMLWCGIGALLCVAGAVYSPVGKEGLAIMAAVLGGAAAAIPFIQAWMILAAGLLATAIIVCYYLYKHNLLSKTNTTLVSAVQEEVEKGNTAVANTVASWATKYVKNADGTTTEVPDPSVLGQIEAVLKNLGRLPTSGSVASSTPTPTPIHTISPPAGSIAPASGSVG